MYSGRPVAAAPVGSVLTVLPAKESNFSADKDWLILVVGVFNKKIGNMAAFQGNARTLEAGVSKWLS